VAIKIKIVASALGVAGLLAAAAVTASSASATSCGSGHACYYYGYNRSQSSFGDSSGIDDFSVFRFNNSTIPLNDHVASADGASMADVALWSDAHNRGKQVTLKPGTTYSSLGDLTNMASSSHFWWY